MKKYNPNIYFLETEEKSSDFSLSFNFQFLKLPFLSF